MEIFIFIFPILSLFISLFPISSKYFNIVYIIYCFCMFFSFCLSVYLFIKLFQLNNNIPLYFYPLFQFNKDFIAWSLRLDIYVSTFISIITFSQRYFNKNHYVDQLFIGLIVGLLCGFILLMFFCYNPSFFATYVIIWCLNFFKGFKVICYFICI